METTQPILKLNNVEVKYHEVILVLKGVSLEIPEGGIIALLGANGAEYDAQGHFRPPQGRSWGSHGRNH